MRGQCPPLCAYAANSIPHTDGLDSFRSFSSARYRPASVGVRHDNFCHLYSNCSAARQVGNPDTYRTMYHLLTAGDDEDDEDAKDKEEAFCCCSCSHFQSRDRLVVFFAPLTSSPQCCRSRLRRLIVAPMYVSGLSPVDARQYTKHGRRWSWKDVDDVSPSLLLDDAAATATAAVDDDGVPKSACILSADDGA